MKKIILTLCLLAGLGAAASAGQISTGAAPGVINYQGRLERDNAPYTGTIHLIFRSYTDLTLGNPEDCACSPVCPDPMPANKVCLWKSSELTVSVLQGIFNASIDLPWQVLSDYKPKFLEVDVEGEKLTPREPINSVPYALVAKKLENGGDINVATMTVDGSIYISTRVGTTRGIRFADNTWMLSAAVGMSTGGVTSPNDLLIQAGTDVDGDTIFSSHIGPIAILKNNGNFGIGVSAPDAKLQVGGDIYLNGALYGGSFYSDATVANNLIVSGGKVTGSNNEYISLGQPDNVISLVSNGASRIYVAANNNVGIGTTNPLYGLHSAGVVFSTSGVRGSSVTIGAFDASSLWNEVRTQGTTSLLLQQSAGYNVGIGTNTPSEKLHVKGSVRAEKGIIASTGAFSGDVTIGGNFTADSAIGSIVNLSSTIIHGSLQVTGGLGSVLGGEPAYVGLNNTFSGSNKYTGLVDISSDAVARYSFGVHVGDFDFPGDSNYLQVGDSAYGSSNATAYLVGGASANALLRFYRGTVESARFETQNGLNLALVVGSGSGATKTLTDAAYHRIMNSTLWVSTGLNTTPAIYASGITGNVAMGTASPDPTARLNVLGDIRISSNAAVPGTGIVFSDGSKLTSASAGLSVSHISTNGDAIVESQNSSVLLKAGGATGLTVQSGGNVGVGTPSPLSLFNVRGGDLMVGAPAPGAYATNDIDDLLVGGSIVVDGAIKQRSIIPVEFHSMTIAGNVYLSTAASAMTRIGGDTIPSHTLDVTGDVNASGKLMTGGTTRIAADGTVGSGGANATWDGVTVGVGRGGTGDVTFNANGVMYGNLTSALQATAAGAQNYLLQGNGGASAPGWVPSTVIATGNTIVRRDASGNFTGATISATSFVGDLSGNATNVTGTVAVGNGGTGAASLTSGGILYGNGTSPVGAFGVLTNGQLLIGDGSGAPTAATLTGTASRVTVTNAAGSITLSGPQDIDAAASPTFTGMTLTGLTGVLKGHGASAITASDVVLTSEVSGVLPVANGGTGLSSVASGNIVYTSAANTFSAAAITAFGRSLIDDADAAASRATIGAAVSGANADITSLTGLTTALGVPYGGTGLNSVASGNIVYTSAANTFSAAAITAFGRSLIDDADAAASRATIGAAVSGANADITSLTGLTGKLHLGTIAKAALLATTPAKGDVYYCSDCPAMIVVGTDTVVGAFATAAGGQITW